MASKLNVSDYVWVYNQNYGGAVTTNTGLTTDYNTLKEKERNYINKTANTVAMVKNSLTNIQDVLRIPGLSILMHGYYIKKTLNPITYTQVIGDILITDGNILKAYLDVFECDEVVKQNYFREFIYNVEKTGTGYAIIPNYQDTAKNAVKVVQVLTKAGELAGGAITGSPYSILKTNFKFIGINSRGNTEFIVHTTLPDLMMAEEDWKKVRSRIGADALLRKLNRVLNSPNVLISDFQGW